AAALARELSHFAALTRGRTVTSIFFGGGTPSLMRAGTVGAILDAIGAFWTVAPGAEITLEANPGSAEADRFRGYRSAGVNRLSLGVQALDDLSLKALGRIHDAAEARRAVELARSIFPRLSFDLIYARPGQSPRAWQAELETAIGMAADHLSLYQLTIEAETPFARLHAAGKLSVPDPEQAAALYVLTQEIAEARGLPAYEISNHAAPGAESRHNLTYWRYRDYVGAGPGAHGRLSRSGVRHATLAERHPERWLEQVERYGHGLVADEALTSEECADEMLLMGLRLREGIPLDRYNSMRGRALDPGRLAFLRREGLVEECPDGRLRATPDGWLLLDSVVADLAA
ncbi:MAG TPA: radical SAM family heme chaperone HemW, partial [Propylenella sp.]